MDGTAATETCRDLLAKAEACVRAGGVETARLDAEVLLAAVLRLGRARLYARLGEPVPVELQEEFAAAVARRARREPLAYITGVREFWSLPLLVTPAVLIPRPETELLVETVCGLLKTGRSREREATAKPSAPTSRPLICDVGTGSGCVAVAVAHERSDVEVVATDLSAAALDVARRNAEIHGVASRITLLETDLLAGIDETTRFDVIVSNPPYVADDEQLAPEIDFEPALALRAGPRGLDVIGRLVREAPARLRPGGRLVLEIGHGQAAAVVEMARGAGFDGLELRNDLAGTPRVLVASREDTSRARAGNRTSERAETPLCPPLVRGEETRGGRPTRRFSRFETGGSAALRSETGGAGRGAVWTRS